MYAEDVDLDTNNLKSWDRYVQKLAYYRAYNHKLLRPITNQLPHTSAFHPLERNIFQRRVSGPPVLLATWKSPLNRPANDEASLLTHLIRGNQIPTKGIIEF